MASISIGFNRRRSHCCGWSSSDVRLELHIPQKMIYAILGYQFLASGAFWSADEACLELATSLKDAVSLSNPFCVTPLMHPFCCQAKKMKQWYNLVSWAIVSCTQLYHSEKKTLATAMQNTPVECMFASTRVCDPNTRIVRHWITCTTCDLVVVAAQGMRFSLMMRGNYAGFDRSAPTSASGGKPKVLKLMRLGEIGCT